MSVRRVAGLIAIATAAVVNAQPVKTPIKGLVSIGAYQFVSSGGQPFNTLEYLWKRPGIFGGIAIVATWDELQPTITDIAKNNTIDQALKAVRRYNAKFRDNPLAVKLRVWGGFEAPPWAMRLDGQEPIRVTFHDKERMLGCVWSPAYRKAWRDFQRMLAERYDGEELIHEVSVTSCMLFTAEPFFIPGDPNVLERLREAGFTDAKYRSCLEDAVADYDGWKLTRIEFPFNPFSETDNAPPIKLDYEFTYKVMRACRERIGERCALDNHDLNVPPLATIAPLYTEMRKMGGEIEFQTFNETPAFYEGTIAYGVGLGASSIELWQDFKGFPDESRERLKHWASFFGTYKAPSQRAR
ncbi:MAG TPA: hypothetical protein VGJ64_04355 [Gemmatimonadaceae bacterium]|jgi:hypothetical protein